MKNKTHLSNASELLSFADKSNRMREQVNCRTIDYSNINHYFCSNTYVDGFIAILVLSGTTTATVNYKTYSLSANTLLSLFSSSIFHFSQCSTDFNGLCLFVSQEFTDEMDSTVMISQRLKYSVRLYNKPLLLLNQESTAILSERIITLSRKIDRTEHFYHKEIIVNSLWGFYLDLSDVIERNIASPGEGSSTRYESIIQAFIELLAIHYQKEHKVDFYAFQLNISGHYLTRIVKSVTGQTVNDFIFDMLYSESRSLLIHSKLSVQEIAVKLNFSDQSAFGKFFKRQSGVSPTEFRKRNNKKTIQARIS